MTQPGPRDDVDLPDWPAPEGREAEADAFKRSLSRAASGLPTLLLFEAIDEDDAANALHAVSRQAGEHAALLDLECTEGAACDPVALAAAKLERSWSDRLYNVRVGESGRRVLPEWVGVIPGLGNLIAAIIVTTVRLRNRAMPRTSRAPPDVRQILRSAERRPVVAIVRSLHLADRERAASLCRLIHDAPVGARLLVAGSIRMSRQGAPPSPIRTTAAGLRTDRLVVHAIAPRSAGALTDVDALANGVTAILETAAVIGEEFDGAAVAALTGRDELEIEDVLAIAARQGIVTALGLRELEDGDIATAYRFATPSLHEAILERLSAVQRAELNTRLGRHTAH